MKYLSILSLTSLVPLAAFSQQQRPNIVVLLADDMRGSTIELLANEGVLTPNINTLISDGVLLSNAHIMGGSNGAVSMPSRAMLLTGRYVYNLEKEGAVIPQNHTTIGEALLSNGYTNYHIGKWHSDHKSFNRCFNDGKDIFFGGMSDHWNVPLYTYNPECDYSKKRPVIKSFTQNNSVEYLPGEYSFSGKHSVDIFTDRAVEYIQNSDEVPFYLNVAYMSPHDPRSTHTNFHTYYDSLNVDLPANFLKQHPFDNGEMNVRDEVLAKLPREESEVVSNIKDYYAMITHLDQSVGRVIEALKSKGIYDNTIVVFAADNGLAVGQHGLMGKQNVYEHSISVPLVVKTAGVKSPSNNCINQSPCYLIDLMPTLLDYVGVPIPESVDALSLRPLIDKGEAVRDVLYYCYRECQRAVSDMTWKLIEYNVNGIRNTQLFNIAEDPMETVDLSSDKKYRKEVNRLRNIMLSERDRCNDNGKFWSDVVF